MTQPVISRLHFENWRSLRNVTIDNLTPITVFVGANSSGKTNILDALHFMRRALEKNASQAIAAWGGYDNIHAVFDDEHLPLHFGLSFRAPSETIYHEVVIRPGDLYSEVGTGELGDNGSPQAKLKRFVSRWQLLRENFVMPTVPSSIEDPGDLNVVDPSARNVLFMLDYMRQVDSHSYHELQADLHWLLRHIEAATVVRGVNETRLELTETALQGRIAPSISGGSARVIAMLTAYYALDMRTPELPGLVVIEEPDTAIHPLLLGNFVELLRTYTEREDRPRQFILTTHNPMLLNYFEPEEVRFVERDANGETTVEGVDMGVANAWFEQDGAFNLGDIWTTRLLGGVPE